MTIKNKTPNNLAEIIRSKKFILILISIIAVFSPFVLFFSTTAAEKAQSNNLDEPFLSMSVLSSNMTLAGYFPADNRTITLGEPLNWNVGVHNGMNSAQFLSVRLKLLNATQAIPNDALNQPSPEKAIFEIQQVVPKNSTWTLPLDWSISQLETISNNSTTAKGDGNVNIQSIVLNGRDITNINTASLKGQGFKMILELWRYDNDSKDFTFAWNPSTSSALNGNTDVNNDKIRSIWTQIWFNVKS